MIDRKSVTVSNRGQNSRKVIDQPIRKAHII